MFFPEINFCLFWRELANSADIATRLYHEATSEALRSPPKIWNTMTKVHDRLIKSIQYRNFKKFISVVHKDNNKDFFQNVLPLPF